MIETAGETSIKIENKKLVHLKRALMEATMGNVGYGFFLDEQAAIYSPDQASPAAKWLNENVFDGQTSGTSFFAPLAVMGALNGIMAFCEMENKKMGHKSREKMFKTLRFVTPFAVALLFEGWEVGTTMLGDTRPDNKALDMILPLVAAAVVTYGNIRGEMNREKISQD